MSDSNELIRGLEGRVEVSPECEKYRPALEAHLLALQLYPGGLGQGSVKLWDAFAVAEDGPQDDRRVFALKAAMEQLDEHWPSVAPREDLRAFQIVGTDRKKDGRVLHEVRINQAVRGRLTLRCGPKPEPPHALGLELQFAPDTEDPTSAAHYFVLLRRDDGRVRAIVFMDEVGLIASQASVQEIRDQIDRSLPAGGPRARWRGLITALQLAEAVDEIPSIYFEVGAEAPDSLKLALLVVDRLESSVLAGLPSRRSRLRMEPLPEDPLAGTDPGGPDDPTTAAARIDLKKAMSQLAARDLEIIGLHIFEGLTEEAIGERLGVTQQAVSKRLKKAYSKLRNLLSR